jgi:hypothetical protein
MCNYARASSNTAVQRIKYYFSKASSSQNPVTYLKSDSYHSECKNKSKSLTYADVLQLQQTIGNRAVCRLLSEIGLISSTTKPVQRQEIPEEEEPLQGKTIEQPNAEKFQKKKSHCRQKWLKPFSGRNLKRKKNFK